jgi:putative glutamine amidotransferase
LPVLIPNGLTEDQFQALAGRLQGILLTGGGDVDPSRYNGLAHERVYDIDQPRDELEIRLVQCAAGGGQPFFGICRGLQVINVALGGTLYSDISVQHPQAIKHDYFPGIPRNHLAHLVRVEDHTQLQAIIHTSSVEVNSLHHQGVQELASRLRATAFSPDGLIEAVELRDHPFGLAVQWHPESLQELEPMQALFRAFVTAAEKYQPGGAARLDD